MLIHPGYPKPQALENHTCEQHLVPSKSMCDISACLTLTALSETSTTQVISHNGLRMDEGCS